MARKNNIPIIPAVILILLAFSIVAESVENRRTLVLENFDQLNRKMTDSGSVWYGYGNIRLRLDSTHISSDSVIWFRETNIIHFYGNVEACDSVQNIQAEQLSYYHRDSVLVARENVVLIQNRDSVKAVSDYAEYDRARDIISLDDSPRLYLNYPDSANMIEILGDYITFYVTDKSVEAENNVVITHQDTRATCGCAEFSQTKNLLILRTDPHVVRDSSDITGQLMEISFADGGVRQIDVFGEAKALFVEDADSVAGEYSGNSMLSGDDITFYFKDDEVRKIAATGAAQSEYYPSPEDTTGAGKNFVSGDTILIYVDNRRITKAEIKGGAEGVYITEGEASDSTSADSLIPSGDKIPDTIFSDSDTLTLSDSTIEVISDTSMVDDTLAVAHAPEDSIHYQGGFLEFFAADRIIRITGDASVQQGQVSLQADHVDYDIPKRVVLAKTNIDTADTNAPSNTLVLRDGSEEIFGSKLIFNVDTKRGKIEDATTQYENAYYRGQDMFKEEEKVFFVEDGKLSSCDLAEPHFHFRSPRMKLIHNDRVIARPVTLYIHTLPVMTIPYYIFPLKRGRHSGILPIKLGNFEQGSRFIGNLGYYWAASEYWDIQSSFDFHENIGVTFNNMFRYNKRYTFDGNIRASYSRDRREFAFGESKRDRWRMVGSHSQTLPYEISFRASGEFVSDKNYSSDYLTDAEERRNRNIISKANFNKRFGRSSLSLSFSHTNNLDDDSRSSSIPTGSFTMPSFHPFGSGREVDGETEKKWYNHLYMGYRNNFGILSSQGKITNTVVIDDTTQVDYESRTWRDYGYLDHSMSLTASQKVLGYFSLGPSVSLQETWYYIMKSDQAHAAGIPADRPYRRGSISAGVSSNTNLYGTLPVNQLGLVALRHVITPSLSFGWSPAITKNDAVRSFTGRGGGGGKQKRISFNVQNLFQAKIKSGETEKKLDLLSVGSGLSYNFEAQDKKYSDIRTTLSSTLLRNVNIRGNLTHSLYDKNDELRWRSPNLKSFSISASFQARGSVADNYVRQGLGSGIDGDTLGLSSNSGLDVDVVTGTDMGKTSGGTEWNTNLSYHYNESRYFGTTTSRTHWVRFTFNMGLTKNWKLKYSQKYDFVRHESIDKIVDLYRKLHCWEAHFYWIPNGSRQGYYFRINVIAIPDIKVEKSESGLRGALFNR